MRGGCDRPEHPDLDSKAAKGLSRSLADEALTMPRETRADRSGLDPQVTTPFADVSRLCEFHTSYRHRLLRPSVAAT